MSFMKRAMLLAVLALGLGAAIGGSVPYSALPNCNTGLNFSTSTLLLTCNTNSLPLATTSQLYGGSGIAGIAAIVSVGSGLSLSGGILTASAGTPVCVVGSGTTSIVCSGGTGGANTAAGTNGGAFAGYNNIAGTGTENVVIGGHGNTINSGSQDVIIGGSGNTLGNGDTGATIIGGTGNSMAAFGGNYNFIAGGSNNQANGNSSEFVAGYNNNASGNASFISGHDNSSSGEANSAMGSSNIAAGGGGGRNLVGGYNNGCGSLDYASIIWAWQVGNCAGNYQAAFGAGPFVNGDTSTFLGNFPQGRSSSSSLYVGGGRQGRGDTSGAEQIAFYQVNCQFNSSTACELKDPSGNRISIPTNNTGYMLYIDMIAVDRTVASHSFATWTMGPGLIIRQGNAGTTQVSTSPFAAGPKIGTFPTCATLPTLAADTTNGALIVTGPTCAGNTDNVSLQARIESIEIRGDF